MALLTAQQQVVLGKKKKKKSDDATAAPARLQRSAHTHVADGAMLHLPR